MRSSSETRTLYGTAIETSRSLSASLRASAMNERNSASLVWAMIAQSQSM